MSAATYQVSLVTPTYNEKQNIALLAGEIFAAISKEEDIDLELIIVDDNSPDGTGDEADKLKDQYPVQVIHRAGKLGLGSAVMEGFLLSQRPYVGVIDADLSHDPVELPKLIRGLSEHDITIGSRFGATSEVEEWAWHRRMISVVGVAMARWITGVEDPLSGYFFVGRPVLKDLELTSSGYKILLEILTKGTYQSHLSLPIFFRNRQFSASKLNWKEHLLFLKQVLYFSLAKLIPRR